MPDYKWKEAQALRSNLRKKKNLTREEKQTLAGLEKFGSLLDSDRVGIAQEHDPMKQKGRAQPKEKGWLSW